MKKKCTCEDPSEFNGEGDPAYDRHERWCDLAPDLSGWLWFPHDGELRTAASGSTLPI